MVKFIAIRVSEDENLMYLFYTDRIAFSVDSIEPEILVFCLNKDFTKVYYLPSEIENLPERDSLPRKLLYSFTTHHHYDHSSGDDLLKKIVPNIKQIKGSFQNFKIENIGIKCINTPCHTMDSICILVDNKYMCTGDTIFYLGCGRFFEGGPENMLNSIAKIKENNDDIILLYGHNYKDMNLKFIKSVCHNIQYKEDERIFLTLKEEKLYNPFFLIDNKIDMEYLRNRKDKFI